MPFLQDLMGIGGESKTTWDPAATREKYNLKLSDAEKEHILANFHPLNPTDLRADGVFEGGGVLGLAFLGALRCCEEIGIKWDNLAGTSAGAITASLLAADYTIDELESIMGELDYTHFLSDEKISIPSDELGVKAGLSLLLMHAKGVLGQYGGDPFQDWIEEKLSAKGIDWFANIEHKGRNLKLIASNVTRAEVLVLPDSLNNEKYKDVAPLGAKNFKVSKAVRMSMSIPLFFEPFNLGDNVVVDGGLVSNFPLWIFDVKEGERPPCPTFGFRLVDTNPSPVIDSPLSMLTSLLKAMMYSRDRHYLTDKDLGRVINIDLTDIETKATDFELSNDAKGRLYREGYLSAKQFFLFNWSWSNHLKLRGFND